MFCIQVSRLDSTWPSKKRDLCAHYSCFSGIPEQRISYMSVWASRSSDLIPIVFSNRRRW